MESPGNTALIEFDPGGRTVVVVVATPPDRIPEPSNVVPLKKFTSSPSVVVVGELTVKGDKIAVNMTDCPVKIAEFGETVKVSEVSTGAAVSKTVLERLPT